MGEGGQSITGKASFVKLGMIGCGKVTRSGHLPALKSVPGIQVAALADTDPATLTRAGDAFGISRQYLDFRELIKDPEVDAIAVCTPVRYHAEIAMAVLQAGKHLFLEKPVTATLDEADLLTAKAENTPVKVLVGFKLRWHRLLRQARDVVRQGALGEIEYLSLSFTTENRFIPNPPGWYKHRDQGGGALVEFASHHFDLWRFLLDSEVDEVCAISRSDDWDDVTGIVTGRMANGTLVTSVLSQGTSEHKEVQIAGRKGCLHVSLDRFDGLAFQPLGQYPGGLRARLRQVARFARELPRAISCSGSGGDYRDTYRKEWQHFAGIIRDSTPAECSLQDGRSALQVTLAALESLHSKHPVKVAQTARRAL